MHRFAKTRACLLTCGVFGEEFPRGVNVDYIAIQFEVFIHQGIEILLDGVIRRGSDLLYGAFRDYSTRRFAEQYCGALATEGAFNIVAIKARVDNSGLEGICFRWKAQRIARAVVQVVQLDDVLFAAYALLGEDALTLIHVEVHALPDARVGAGQHTAGLCTSHAGAISAPVEYRAPLRGEVAPNYTDSAFFCSASGLLIKEPLGSG